MNKDETQKKKFEVEFENSIMYQMEKEVLAFLLEFCEDIDLEIIDQLLCDYY